MMAFPNWPPADELEAQYPGFFEDRAVQSWLLAKDLEIRQLIADLLAREKEREAWR